MTRLLPLSVDTACVVALIAMSSSFGRSSAGTNSVDPVSSIQCGVSLSGAEFGTDKVGFSNETPGIFGRDYTYNTERSVQYFCERGASLLRLPIRWERIQPRLGEPLDELELARLRVAIGWASKHNGRVIIDIHNFGRYVLVRNGRPRACAIDEEVRGENLVTREHFVDLWRRLSLAFRDEPTIYAYGLMNEPHDMGKSNWKAISQAAVDAIRGGNDFHRILVAGDGWSKAHRFEEANGSAAWIRDSANNIAYEAHCYFDRDGSGRYANSYEEESGADADLVGRGERRVQSFAQWCARNGVRGFVGELAVPAADSRWQPGLERALAAMKRAGLEGCYWGGGEWWGDHPLSIQPTAGFRTPSPLMAIFTR